MSSAQQVYVPLRGFLDLDQCRNPAGIGIQNLTYRYRRLECNALHLVCRVEPIDVTIKESDAVSDLNHLLCRRPPPMRLLSLLANGRSADYSAAQLTAWFLNRAQADHARGKIGNARNEGRP